MRARVLSAGVLAALLVAGVVLVPRLAPEDPPRLDVGVAEWGWTVRPELSSGPVEVRLLNTGALAHDLELVRLDGDHRAEEMTQLAPLAPLPDWARAVGGVSMVPPGGVQREARVTLDAGRYAVLCRLPVPDQPDLSHASKGLLAELTVPAR